jgi:threonine/homoserine/homoserine lactone efflux protein
MYQVCQDWPVDVFITGLIAGIALAIPLGPMAILLISTTIKHGRGIGVYGAAAMASVDFSYAALVFAFGNAIVGALNEWVLPMRIAGSAILVFVALKIFLEARKSSKLESPELGNSPTSRLKTYVKFFGLTVLNPATAFYFVGITPGVAAMASSGASANGFSVMQFAFGVFVGSIVWQMSLVFAAHLTSKFTDVKVQHRIQYAGALLILVLAIGLLLK